MAQAQVWQQPLPNAVPAELEAAPPAPPRVNARAVQQSQLALRRDLRRLAVIAFLMSGLGGSGVLYLTAFARLTAHGAKLEQLVSERQATELQNAALFGQVTQLTRPDRVKREAERIGLKLLAPADAEKVRLSAVPAAHAPVAGGARPARVRPGAAPTAARGSRTN